MSPLVTESFCYESDPDNVPNTTAVKSCSVQVKLLRILTQNLVIIEPNNGRAADPSTNIDLICVPDNHYVLCPTQQHRCSTLLISCFDRCLCLFSLFDVFVDNPHFFSCFAFVLLSRFLLLVPLTSIMSQCSGMGRK